MRAFGTFVLVFSALGFLLGVILKNTAADFSTPQALALNKQSMEDARKNFENRVLGYRLLDEDQRRKEREQKVIEENQATATTAMLCAGLGLFIGGILVLVGGGEKKNTETTPSRSDEPPKI